MFARFLPRIGRRLERCRSARCGLRQNGTVDAQCAGDGSLWAAAGCPPPPSRPRSLLRFFSSRLGLSLELLPLLLFACASSFRFCSLCLTASLRVFASALRFPSSLPVFFFRLGSEHTYCARLLCWRPRARVLFPRHHGSRGASVTFRFLDVDNPCRAA